MIDRGEEKKEDIPTMIEARIVDPKLSASKRRGKAAGSAGLSELSKQLRIFQAKNEGQAVDINRLERQLRILADLQGINVADLRSALEAACANEAFGEMQHRVAKLRAELEAATLAKQAELRKDMAAPEIANLQLRIGELEEVEEKQEREIHHLYEQLRHERARATRLESECDQLRKDANDYHERLKLEAARAAQLEANFQDKLRKMQEEQANKLHQGIQSNDQSGSFSSVSPEITADYERLLKSMKEKDDALRQARAELKAEQEKSMQRMKDLDHQAHRNQVDTKVDHEQMLLLIKQLQEADSQNELRLAQYKSRFALQDERITDMGQQLESLYAAFGLIKEEQDAEKQKRASLQTSLEEADSKFAHHMDDKQKKKHQGRVQQQRSTPTRTPTNKPPPSLHVSTTPNTPTTQGTAIEEYTPPTARAIGNPFPSTNTDRSREARTPTTWQLIFPKEHQSRISQTYFSEEPDVKGTLIAGTLIVKSKSMVRKWKSKNARLYLSGDHYQWDLGEGKSFALQFGISRVEFNPNHPLSFVVYTNPSDQASPVVHAATSSETDYYHWMSALTKATTGAEYHPTEEPTRRSLAETPAGNRSPFGNEASDFERALELSKQHV
jgi:hypothetical protein